MNQKRAWTEKKRVVLIKGYAEINCQNMTSVIDFISQAKGSRPKTFRLVTSKIEQTKSIPPNSELYSSIRLVRLSLVPARFFKTLAWELVRFLQVEVRSVFEWVETGWADPPQPDHLIRGALQRVNFEADRRPDGISSQLWFGTNRY